MPIISESSPATTLSPRAVDSDEAGTIEAALGYAFERRELLEVALTHRSFANERGADENYERLEFLGDSVLGLVAAHWLYSRFPTRPEGGLAKLKGVLVSAPALAHHAERLGLGERVRLGVGEKRSGGHAKLSILADAMEAIFGAVYLDGGLEAARLVIEPLLEQGHAERRRYFHADAKTALQEFLQSRRGGLPTYRLAEETGPDHQKRFTVECLVEGAVAGRGEGRSKKLAEQRAATAVLDDLGLGDV